VIGAGALDFAFAVFDAAPEVASAYDYSDFYTECDAFFDSLAYASYDVKVQTCLFFACERFAAYFKQYAFVCGPFSGHLLTSDINK